MKKKCSADKMWQMFVDDFFATTSDDELRDILSSVQRKHEEVNGVNLQKYKAPPVQSKYYNKQAPKMPSIKRKTYLLSPLERPGDYLLEVEWSTNIVVSKDMHYSFHEIQKESSDESLSILREAA